ncbi:hypothetical protein [Oenococcus oeni]|uniref:hypothetical protein n=1 Tax=Oenococcus oeni TaxID=1247 RepID=UPI0027E2DDD1|nr:hypothetical protein [Oenococcus oeni]
MAFLKSNQVKVNKTLIAENMRLEHIFSITFNGTLYALSMLVLQSNGSIESG